MEKLKLPAIPDHKAIKVTIELSAPVHRDLVAYAEIFERETGQKIELVKLVGPMLARFMLTDRAFLRSLRKKRTVQ